MLSIELQIGRQFQDWIDGINNENESSFIDQIITSFISFYCDNKLEENLQFLAYETALAAEIRPKSIHNLTKLVKEITTTRKTDKFANFKNYLVDTIMSTQSIYLFEMKVRLLHSCFEAEIYKIDEICEYLNIFPMDQTIRALILLSIFVSDIDKHDSNLVNSILGKLEVYSASALQFNQYLEVDINKYREFIMSLRENDYKLSKQITNSIYPEDSVEFTIYTDNIDELQKLFSESEFNPEIRLKQSFLNPNTEILSPLQFAAFHGSTKCFEYLEKLNELDDSIPDFAVQGGSMEVVKVCDAKGLSFSNALVTAALNRRTEILEFLLKTKEFSQPEVMGALELCIRTKSIASIETICSLKKNK